VVVEGAVTLLGDGALLAAAAAVREQNRKEEGHSTWRTLRRPSGGPGQLPKNCRLGGALPFHRGQPDVQLQDAVGMTDPFD
jgi:hypothetical protein